MIQLKNGCRCSEPKITPSNWDKSSKSMQSRWSIQYRFYDPQHPGGKQILISAGMNRISDYKERVAAARSLLQDEITALKERDYNPISKEVNSISQPADTDYEIHPETPLFEALQAAYNRMAHERETMKDLRSVMKYCKQAAQLLKIDDKPLKEVERRHVRMILDRCGKIKTTWTARTFNWYRSNLMMLFSELQKVDAIEYNPVEKIEKKATTVKKRTILQADQRKEVDAHLRKENYRLWLFMHIFYHSGSRETEILRVKGQDVDLQKQEVRYLIKKGRAYREVIRPIKDIALNLWQQALVGCSPEQVVFSRGLLPGEKSIRPEQVTRRWRKWVKVKLGVEADFYSLKHLNTTEMSAQVGTAITAALNQHSEAVLKKHYDVNGAQREMDIIKKVGNTFV